jgi:hypothetical protein
MRIRTRPGGAEGSGGLTVYGIAYWRFGLAGGRFLTVYGIAYWVV